MIEELPQVQFTETEARAKVIDRHGIDICESLMLCIKEIDFSLKVNKPAKARLRIVQTPEWTITQQGQTTVSIKGPGGYDLMDGLEPDSVTVYYTHAKFPHFEIIFDAQWLND